MKKAPFQHTPNIEWKNGAWRYRVSKRELPVYGVSWHKIGTTAAEVYEFLAEQARREAGQVTYVATMGQAFDKYLAEVVPLKAHSTRHINRISLNRLKVAFNKSHPMSIKTSDIYLYRDTVGEANGKKSANNDIEVLSHVFSKLIEWGVIENWQHPIRGQRIKFSLPDRDRYVEHDEIVEALTVANPMLQIYIPFKLKTGLDKSTILRIRLDEDVTEEGIYYSRRKLQRHDSSKRPKRKLIPWDDELRALHEAAASLHRRESTHLFSARSGKPYIDEEGRTEGFNSVWQRFMKKVLTDTKVKERFTEHDLRAKNASDEEDEGKASKRMDHSSQSTTNRVYRRKAEISDSLGLQGIGLGDLIAQVERAKEARDTKAETRYKRKSEKARNTLKSGGS